MADPNEKTEARVERELIVCPDCRGDGIAGGSACPKCCGRGVYLRSGQGEYYWGRELLGHSAALRGVHLFYQRASRALVYVLALVSLLYGVLFILGNNQGFFLDFKIDVESAIADDDLFRNVFIMLYFLLVNLVEAVGVIFRKTGTESFMFWAGSLGAMHFYYHNKAGDASRKDIDLGDKRFLPLYEREAPSFGAAVDIADYASQTALLCLERALDLAHGKKQAPASAHLALALVREPGIERLLRRLEVDPRDLANFLEFTVDALPPSDCYRCKGFFRETIMSPELKRCAIAGLGETVLAGLRRLEPEALFLSLLDDPTLEKYFHDQKLKREDIRSAALWSRVWGSAGAPKGSARPRRIRHTIMNKAWTARVTPELDQFSYDLTDYARSGLNGPVVDRTRELDSLMRILERTSKNNALLIGEEGCGRTTVVKALANRMVRDEVLPTLKDKRLVVLDIGSIVAGARAGGDLELRLQRVLGDMGKSGNIILYIPDIHNVAAAGSAEGFDASKILAPILSQGLFQVIGSTDYRSYRRYIEPRGDFANSFDMVKVEELSEEDALSVLAIQAGMIEAREGVTMTYGAVKAAVELSKRYIPDRLLPGKAIDLLSETAVEVRRRGAGSLLRDEDVMSIITEKTGIPLNSINANEADKLLNLEESLRARVIGQEAAVKAVASAIRRVRVGMKLANRPVGTFLFLGPTGVGKTELAKALAQIYYGDENAMIRLDMSEYQTVNSVEKLIGYSSAAAGSETDGGGILTEAVKRKPFSLVLLDELEKADKNVLNLFLQVFDDGRLTDNWGRTVDFTNTIIIATTNAGSKATSKIFVDEGSNDRVFEMIEPYLLQSFTPEFLNRFTAKIIFRSLTPQDLDAIAGLQVKQLARRLDEAQGIKVEVAPEALAYLTQIGYSPEYGARFLQRTLQEKLENLIAVEFLKGNIKRGDTFRVGVEALRNI